MMRALTSPYEDLVRRALHFIASFFLFFLSVGEIRGAYEKSHKICKYFKLYLNVTFSARMRCFIYFLFFFCSIFLSVCAGNVVVFIDVVE